MYQSHVIMHYIDELRKKQKIRVNKFNEGIVATRTYSRYISGEFDIEIDVLIMYLKRLGYQLPDFLTYVYNNIRAKNIGHSNFVKLVNNNRNESASKYINSIDPKIKSEVSHMLLPISILKMEYYNNNLMKPAILDQMKKFIDIRKILDSKVISREELKSLIIYFEFCMDLDKKNIIGFFEKFVDGEKEIISLEYQIDQMLIYHFLLGYYLSKETFSQKLDNHIRELFNTLFSHLEHLNIEDIYPGIIEYLVSYFKLTKNEEMYKKSVFYLVSHLLSCKNVDTKKIVPDYLRIYIDSLQNNHIFDKTFFEHMRFQL